MKIMHPGITDVQLSGYKTISYESENCEVYYKGNLTTITGNLDIYSLIDKFVRILSNEPENSESHFSKELSETTGLFSLIIKHENDCYFISDIIRGYPLIYGFIENQLIVSNNLDETMKKYGSLVFSYPKMEEYIASGYVYGNGTIVKDLHGIQAAEIITVKNQQIKSTRYFRFNPGSTSNDFFANDEFSKEFDQVLLRVFNRMIKYSTEVNNWIVPLSGGHDSRIIVNSLSKLGIKNVICYSYGNSGNEQSELSRSVAEALDYKWYFIEYQPSKWKYLHDIGLIDKFINFAFNGVSTPHFQDFLAINELKEKGILKDNDIFVPGHTFDFLVGSNLNNLDSTCTNKVRAIKRVVKKFTKIKTLSASPVKTIEAIFEESKLVPQKFQEYFNWQELRAKFLANACRGYEFFGFDFRLPFWDRELVDFWMKVPDEYRKERNLFLDSERDGILREKLLAIPFFGKNDRVSEGIVEKILRKLLPGFVKTFVLRFTRRKVDFNAGVNQIYELRASKVRELLEPLDDYPKSTRKYFRNFLDRLTFQIDYHFLTSLYTVRKYLDFYK